MKKIAAFVLVLSLITASALMFAGCNNGDTASTVATETATEKATEAATASVTETATEAAKTTSETPVYSNSDDGQSSSNADSNSGAYAGISAVDAVAKAKEQLGEKDGLIAEYTEEGYYADKQAWVITFTDNSGSKYTAYVGGDFCYIDQNNLYAGISQEDATAKALQTLGGADTLTVTYVSQGHYMETSEAWEITITDSASEKTFIAYVGYDFCYIS